MAYLLDANVFIEARRRYYGLDFCPAFWDWLIAANARGSIYSIDRIREEMIGTGDDLSLRVQQRGAEFFLPIDEDTLKSLVTAMEWSRTQNFRQSALAFLLMIRMHISLRMHTRTATQS